MAKPKGNKRKLIKTQGEEIEFDIVWSVADEDEGYVVEISEDVSIKFGPGPLGYQLSALLYEAISLELDSVPNNGELPAGYRFEFEHLNDFFDVPNEVFIPNVEALGDLIRVLNYIKTWQD